MARPGNNRQTLDYLIDLFAPEIRDAFRAAIQSVVDDAIIVDMIKAITDGDPAGAFQALGFTPAAMRPVTEAIERAFEQGGVLTGGNFPQYLNTPSGRTVFRFDVRNSRAEAWLRDRSSQLVTRLTNEARENVQTTLQRGMIDGRNPRNVALDIVGRIQNVNGQNVRVGGIVGLTTQQEKWVANTRRDLVNLDANYFGRELRDKRFDSVVQRAINEGRALPSDKIDQIVGSYKNNALRYRGETIGRTEAIQSLNRSEWEAHMQAVDSGALRKQDVSRHWDAAMDGRTRWSHAALDKKYDKKGVGLDEPFVSPSGARLMYPGDVSLGATGDEVINCRCRVRLKVDFLAGWNDAGPKTPKAKPKPKPIVPPAPPPETPDERNTRLDKETKAYVLENGRRTNKEFLWAYDRVTGKQVGQNSGTNNNVGIPPELAKEMYSTTAEMIVHHNHPGSRSFSYADLYQTTNAPGLSGLWAHGHNGSSYYAEGLKPLSEATYKKVEKEVLDNWGMEQYKKDPDAYQRLTHHAMSIQFAKRGYIKYVADLQGETADAYERIKDWFVATFGG
jgi:hypothetical protein